MDKLAPEIENLLRAKEERRRRLQALSFHDKVLAVVQMQGMAAPVLRARGKQVRIWQLNEPTENGDLEFAPYSE